MFDIGAILPYPYMYMAAADRPRKCIERKPTAQTIYLGGIPINCTTLAANEGLDPGGISKILNGRRKPSLGYARRIAAGLGMTIDGLLSSLENRHQKLNIKA